MAILVVAGMALFSEWGLSSISPELTQEAARGYLLSCVNEAIEAEVEEESMSFVTVERDQEGKICGVSTNTAALNGLRVRVLSRLEDSLNGSVTVKIPAGSLTEIALLNGRGFPVPLKLWMEGVADLSFQTEFTSAGINQSCYRVTMTVSVQAYSQSKRFSVQVEEETSTVIAETVVVGTVPDAAVLRNQ